VSKFILTKNSTLLILTINSPLDHVLKVQLILMRIGLLMHIIFIPLVVEFWYMHKVFIMM